jgi:hypothetical protein
MNLSTNAGKICDLRCVSLFIFTPKKRMTDFNYAILVSFFLSSLIVGGIAFYFFKSHIEHLQENKRLDLRLKHKKETLPIRIQAYERLTLLTERISLGNLLNRVKPISSDKNDYENLLINNIEQEFEHNLVQQIYVSDECWNVIKTVKNTTISTIRKTNMSNSVTDAYKLRETLISDMLDQKNSPNELAIQILKRDLKAIL